MHICRRTTGTLLATRQGGLLLAGRHWQAFNGGYTALEKSSSIVGVDQVPGFEVTLHAAGSVSSLAVASLREARLDCCGLGTLHVSIGAGPQLHRIHAGWHWTVQDAVESMRYHQQTTSHRRVCKVTSGG